MMIWKFDERYVENIIKKLNEFTGSLERAKTLLKELKGAEVSSLRKLRKVSDILEGVLAELEPLSESISELAVKAEDAENEVLVALAKAQEMLRGYPVDVEKLVFVCPKCGSRLITINLRSEEERRKILENRHEDLEV